MLRASKLSNRSTDYSYEVFMILDLLERGGLDKDTRSYIKMCVAKQDIESIQSLLNEYELRGRGVDTKEVLEYVLKDFGLSISGSLTNGYVVSGTPNRTNKTLIGKYAHLREVGDKLRALEVRPGALSLKYVCLYSWGTRLKQEVLVKNEGIAPVVPSFKVNKPQVNNVVKTTKATRKKPTFA